MSPARAGLLIFAGMILLATATAADNTAKKLLVGDTKVDVLAKYQGEALPRPDKILIVDFNVPPDVVSIDDSVAARLHGPGHHKAVEQGKAPDSAEAVAKQVQSSFSKSLVHELQQASLPVQAMAANGANAANAATEANAPNAANEAGAAAHEANSVQQAPGTLLVRGDFTTVDQGNKTKRLLIGFGKGASDVQAHVTVSQVRADQPLVLLEFRVQSKSGKKPGAAATVGADAATLGTVSAGSAAAGVAAGGVMDRSASVQADAARMAKSVAKQIIDLMNNAQTWTAAPSPAPPPAAPPASPPPPGSR